MQINTNTTGMPAELTVATDKHGRDHCVIVVKGTFDVRDNGDTRPSEVQEPLILADVPFGAPESSCIKYECEFSLHKPRADLIVNGKAIAPGGKPAKDVMVALEIGVVRKEARVFGDRHWQKGILSFSATEPVPFLEMPLRFERAFGGSDHSHESPKYHGTEIRNTMGVGFRKNSDGATIEGTLLPNLEHPKKLMQNWSDTPPPVGFGVVSRNWQPRSKFAGTYDQRWLDDRFPFLPEDFDDHYFQSAPADQQMAYFEGGEVVRCGNMTASGTFQVNVPRVKVSITFRFRDRDVIMSPKLDTLIVEPDRQRVLALWRSSVPLGRKLMSLREVVVRSPR